MPICCNCQTGTAPLSGGINIAAKTGEAWINGSPVDSIGMQIIIEQGLDVADYDGVYQGITIVLAYDIIDVTKPAGQEVVGSWITTRTITHTGPKAVTDFDKYSVNTTSSSDSPPTNPDEIVADDPNWDDSSLSTSGLISPTAAVDKAMAQAQADSWQVLDNARALGPLPAGWSGVWVRDPNASTIGHAIVSIVAFQPNAFILGAGGSDFFADADLKNGELKVPISYNKIIHEWSTGQNTLAPVQVLLPWRTTDRVFADQDINAPDIWEVLPVETDKAYSVEVIQPTGDLWPLFDG